MNNKNKIIWSTVGIGCNVFISVFLLMVVARANGDNNGGIFTFAFSLANTLFVLGTFGGRTYQVTDGNGEFTEGEYVGFRISTSVLMVIVSLIFVIVNRYNIYKSSIIMLLIAFKFMESISDVYFGIMQKDNRLDCIGKSMTAKAILGILVFTILEILTRNLILSIIALVIVNIVIFSIYDLNIVSKIKRFKISFRQNMLGDMFKTCFYFFAFTFLSAIVINFPRYAIDIYSTEKIQEIYGFIIMPATSIALLGQFMLQPILVDLSNLYNSKNVKAFRGVISKVNILLIAFTLICETAAYIIGIPVLEIIFKKNLQNYKWYLLILILASAFSTIASVLSTALTTMRTTKEQLIIYILNTIVVIFLSLILVSRFKLLGGVLSYFIIMVLLLFSYFVLYKSKIIKGVTYE